MVNTQMNVQSRKLNIIGLVMSIHDDSLLAGIERDALRHIDSAEKKPNIWDAVKPVRKQVSLAQMIEEQHSTPIDKDVFFALAQQVELTDPIDELLATLTA